MFRLSFIINSTDRTVKTQCNGGYQLKKNVLVLLAIILIYTLIPNSTFASSELNGFDTIKSIAEEKQVIIVNNNNGTKATLSTYENINGNWRKALPNMEAVVGYNGIATKSKEGDGKTPIGIYTLGTAFGWGGKPSGLKMPYRATTENDYWVDDASSADYNKWITYSGNPSSRWNSFERLKQPLYKYAVAINYNVNPIIKGKGSAIFLHVWRNSSSPTAGCVALSEQNLLKVLNWLNPSKKPIIVMGKTNQINQLLMDRAVEAAKPLVADAQIKANKLRGKYLASSKAEVVVSSEFSSTYSIAKAAISKAQDRINLLPTGTKKTELQNGLDAVKMYQDRSARFIDAIQYGKNTVTKSTNNVSTIVQSDSFNQELVSHYHQLSAAINKEEAIIGKVYDAETRKNIAEVFVMPAKIARETVVYEVSIYELLSKINHLIDQNNTLTAKAELEKLDRLKNRALDIKRSGNELHPGKYPDLPGMKAYLEKYESDTRSRVAE
jgi:L,D-peptidoglycan transpeptidase YkuD (ErfK/YbiS/YcfS/YnhG family)